MERDMHDMQATAQIAFIVKLTLQSVSGIMQEI